MRCVGWKPLLKIIANVLRRNVQIRFVGNVVGEFECVGRDLLAHPLLAASKDTKFEAKNPSFWKFRGRN